jgi:hypothetical protein
LTFNITYRAFKEYGCVKLEYELPDIPIDERWGRSRSIHLGAVGLVRCFAGPGSSSGSAVAVNELGILVKKPQIIAASLI